MLRSLIRFPPLELGNIYLKHQLTVQLLRNWTEETNCPC